MNNLEKFLAEAERFTADNPRERIYCNHWNEIRKLIEIVKVLYPLIAEHECLIGSEYSFAGGYSFVTECPYCDAIKQANAIAGAQAGGEE